MKYCHKYDWNRRQERREVVSKTRQPLPVLEVIPEVVK